MRDCSTCQQRCGPHRVRRLKRLECLADDLEACGIRQAPELLQAVSDAQSESVAVPLALDLDAGLHCKSKGKSSKPAKRLPSGKFKHMGCTKYAFSSLSSSGGSSAPSPCRHTSVRVALLRAQGHKQLDSARRVQGSSTSSCLKVAARPLSSERQSGTVAGSSSENTGGSPTSSLPCARRVPGILGTEQSPALLHSNPVASLWPTFCGWFGYNCLRAVRQAHLSHL